MLSLVAKIAVGITVGALASGVPTYFAVSAAMQSKYQAESLVQPPTVSPVSSENWRFSSCGVLFAANVEPSLESKVCFVVRRLPKRFERTLGKVARKPKERAIPGFSDTTWASMDAPQRTLYFYPGTDLRSKRQSTHGFIHELSHRIFFELESQKSPLLNSFIQAWKSEGGVYEPGFSTPGYSSQNPNEGLAEAIAFTVMGDPIMDSYPLQKRIILQILTQN